VKSPKGFGKSYFTFASVLAHSTEITMQSLITKVDYLLKNSFLKESDELDENDPPLEILTPICITNQRPCHCNHFYTLKTTLSLKINHFIPRCPYYTTYFAFRRTGVHPPQYIS
jgi:hypothetical protein